ncbi:MAG: NPCBM/NEW2 domain-containing protein [Planctomycetota bacterium]
MARTTLILQALLATVALAAAARSQSTSAPVAGFNKHVIIVYFNPADRTCLPDYRARIDRIMTEIQAWYRSEMQHNGCGPLTFPLERAADGKLVIHVVRGTRAYAEGEEITATELRDVQVKPALLKEGIDIEQEHVIIFANTVFVSDSPEEEAKILRSSSHYCGSGDHRHGTAWVTDYELLDTLNLPRKTPKILDGGTRPYGLGGYVVTYVGGVAHEFGHALGLPHNRETAEQHEQLGYALMGNGNYHLFAERAGLGQGDFLSKPHATILASHPLFKRDAQNADVEPQVMWRDIEFAQAAGAYMVRARVAANLPAYAVVAYHDPVTPRMDYDATSWVSMVNRDGRFEIRVEALEPGACELRLRCYLTNNTRSELSFRFTLAESLAIPVAMLARQALYELHARPAIEAKDAAALRAAIAKLAGADDIYLRRAQAHERLMTRPPTTQRALDAVAADVRDVLLATIKWESAEVGWEQPMVDREGDRPLESGRQLHDSGIYAHANSRYVYRLGGKWQRFTSAYGLQNYSDGSVVFVVKCDGVEKFRSTLMREWTEESVEIEVAGVATLELIVEDGGDGKWGDCGIWFSPRLTR